MGSLICLGGIADNNANLASLFPPFFCSSGNTIPGESKTVNLLSILISLMLVVTPARFPTGQAFELLPCLLVNALMMEDLPTLGYPITPTTIDLLTLDLAAKLFNAWSKVLAVAADVRFLLNAEADAVGDAFTGIVGKADFNTFIHWFITLVGIKSTLLRSKINLLP